MPVPVPASASGETRTERAPDATAVPRSEQRGRRAPARSAGTGSTSARDLAAWPLCALAIAAVVYAQRWSTIEVRIEQAGRVTAMRTRASSVGQFLVSHAIDVSAGDLIAPPLETRLREGSTIRIREGRTLRVRADGVAHRLRSQGQTPRAILTSLDVPLGVGDVVVVDGAIVGLDDELPAPSADRDARSAPSAGRRVADAAGDVRSVPIVDAPGPSAEGPVSEARRLAALAAAPTLDESLSTIEVLRAVPVTVVEEGIPLTLALAGPTVGIALRAAGLHLWPEDVVRPSLDAPLAGRRTVVIHRATSFQLDADGEVRQARARADTVAEALAKAGVRLRGKDYAIPPGTTRLREGMGVQVVRVVEDFLVREVSLPFRTETEADHSMALDDSRVVRPGVAGSKTQRIRIIYEDGEEVERELVEESVLSEPQAELVAYGTQIEWRSIDTPEGPKRYWRHLRVLATSYSASRAGTPTWVPWYGRTRLGWEMRKGIVAVDPRIIPMRTNLFVPGYGVGIAGDTGGGIRSYHIDLGYDDDNYKRWRQWVDLYLLEPLPPESEIRWLLP